MKSVNLQPINVAEDDEGEEEEAAEMMEYAPQYVSECVSANRCGDVCMCVCVCVF